MKTTYKNQTKSGKSVVHLNKKCKLSDQDLIEELGFFVSLCRISLEHKTQPQVAEMAGLAVSTVYNLFSGKTKFPRFMTVQKLDIAAGLRLNMTKAGVKVSVA